MANDPHYFATSVLLHFDGQDGSSTIVDNSPRPKTFITHGNTAITTAQGKFGGACIAMDGSGHLSSPEDSDYSLGTDDFTVEMWVKTTSTNGYLVTQPYETEMGWPPNGVWGISFSRYGVRWDDYVNVNNLLEGGKPINDGQWHHVAVVRLGQVLSLYIDGEIDTYESFSPTETSDFTTPGGLLIGCANDLTFWRFSGYLDEVRVTKGVARYTSDFVPASEPFPSGEGAPAVLGYVAAPQILGAPQAQVHLPAVQLWAAAPSPLMATRSGVDAFFVPLSIAASRLGTHRLDYGMPPNSVAMHAGSLKQVRLGTPSLHGKLHAGPATSLAPARFGQPQVFAGLYAQSLQPVSLGTPALVMRAQSGALQPVRFGAPALQLGFGVAGLRSARFGTARTRLSGLSFTPESLEPVGWGMPALGGMAMRARTLCPARFGRPTLERGTAC